MANNVIQRLRQDSFIGSSLPVNTNIVVFTATHRCFVITVILNGTYDNPPSATVLEVGEVLTCNPSGGFSYDGTAHYIFWIFDLE